MSTTPTAGTGRLSNQGS